MRKNKGQKRTRRRHDFLARELSAEDLLKTLAQIGELLKAVREARTTLPKARFRHYERGVNMRLSTFLKLLQQFNITTVGFFEELKKLRE